MTGRAALSAAKPTTTNVEFAGPAALVLLLLAGPVLYGVGLWAASVADGQPLSRAVCFDATVADHLAPVRLMIATAMAAGAFLLFFATPWMLGAVAVRRTESKRATAGAWSLAANSAALILVCLVLRNTVGVGRWSLLLGWMAWSGLLLLAAWKPASAPGEIGTLLRRWGPGMLIGLAAVILATALFCREQFVQCFNGDGIETLGLAASLRDHFLPYGEIETAGRMGTVIVNPSLINSYWTCALQLLLGEAELATRLSFSVWWLGVFATALCMVRPGDAQSKWLPAIPLALLVFLAATWYTFYVGYNPYMTDLANPGVPDALFTLLLLWGLNCLREKDLAGWVILTALASLVLYAGPVMFVLTATAALIWQPVPRAGMLRAVLAGSGLLLGLVLFYVAWGWWDGSLRDWPSTISMEYLQEYFAPVPRGRTALLFASYFLLGCGVVPAVGLLRPFWGKNHMEQREVAWDRTVATVVVVYLLIIMAAGHKNLHYLGPLLPIPLILWLRLPRRAAGPVAAGWATALLAAGGLAVSLFLSWPASRPVFTENRRLGQLTTFQTDPHEYEEACRGAQIAEELYEQRLLGWRIGGHTWVWHSEMDARLLDPRPLVITDGAAPSDYQLVFQSRKMGVRLFSRDPVQTRWMASQPSPSGLDRWPWVFRPIAIPLSARQGARP